MNRRTAALAAAATLAVAIAPAASAYGTLTVANAGAFYVSDEWGLWMESNGYAGLQPGDYWDEACWCYVYGDTRVAQDVASTCFAYNPDALTNACVRPEGSAGASAPAPVVSPQGTRNVCVLGPVCAPVPNAPSVGWTTVHAGEVPLVLVFVEVTALNGLRPTIQDVVDRLL